MDFVALPRDRYCMRVVKVSEWKCIAANGISGGYSFVGEGHQFRRDISDKLRRKWIHFSEFPSLGAGRARHLYLSMKYSQTISATLSTLASHRRDYVKCLKSAAICRGTRSSKELFHRNRFSRFNFRKRRLST